MSTWWLLTNPVEKYAQVKIAIFHKHIGENKEYLKPPPIVVKSNSMAFKKKFRVKQKITLYGGLMEEGIRRTGLEEGDSKNHEVINKAHR